MTRCICAVLAALMCGCAAEAASARLSDSRSAGVQRGVLVRPVTYYHSYAHYNNCSPNRRSIVTSHTEYRPVITGTSTSGPYLRPSPQYNTGGGNYNPPSRPTGTGGGNWSGTPGYTPQLPQVPLVVPHGGTVVIPRPDQGTPYVVPGSGGGYTPSYTGGGYSGGGGYTPVPSGAGGGYVPPSGGSTVVPVPSSSGGTTGGTSGGGQGNTSQGNNGVGNGVDPQPPGNPPPNDPTGTGPGNPGNAHGSNPNSGGGQGNSGNSQGGHGTEERSKTPARPMKLFSLKDGRLLSVVNSVASGDEYVVKTDKNRMLKLKKADVVAVRELEPDGPAFATGK